MIESQAPIYLSVSIPNNSPTLLKLLTTTLFLGGLSLQEMTGIGAEVASCNLAAGHGSCKESEDSFSRGDSCVLGTHGQLRWCSGEEEEDL